MGLQPIESQGQGNGKKYGGIKIADACSQMNPYTIHD